MKRQKKEAGQKVELDAGMKALAKHLREDHRYTVKDVAKVFGMKESTMYYLLTSKPRHDKVKTFTYEMPAVSAPPLTITKPQNTMAPLVTPKTEQASKRITRRRKALWTGNRPYVMALYPDREMSVMQVARTLGKAKTRAHMAYARLHRKGIVEKRSDAGGKRGRPAMFVRLTDAGRSKAERAFGLPHISR